MGKLTKQDLLEHMDKYKDAVVIIGPGAINSVVKEQDAFSTHMTNKMLRREPEKFWSFFKTQVYSGADYLTPAQQTIVDLKDKIHRVYNQNTDGILSAHLPVSFLHGRDDKFKCNSCKTIYTSEYVMSFDTVPECELCGKPLRPDMLLVGENYWQDMFDDFKEDLLKTHTVFLVGFDFGEEAIFNLVLDYAEMKDVRNSKEEEKRMIISVGQDSMYNIEELANFEFIVPGDVNESMVRLMA